MFALTILKTDFGPMAKHEANAVKGDIYTTEDRPYADADDDEVHGKGKVIDLVFPVAVLIICCVIGMIYTGGFFSGVDFISAFREAMHRSDLCLEALRRLL